MGENFFEGKDFNGIDFKALIPKYYPGDYRAYIEEETNLLKSKVANSNKILEAGVGIGRLIPELAPIVTEFIGVDNAQLMLNESKMMARRFSNVKIVECDLEKIDQIFSKNYFDFSLCVWNTLGNVKDEVQVLRALSFVTIKSIFITVYLKGTVEQRKNWYRTVGIDIHKIDEKNEIFYSKSGLKSKSYSLEDIKKIADKSNIKVKDCKILNKVILWVELIK